MQSDSAAIAAAIIFGIFGTIIGIAAYVLFAWFLMKIFEKAGVQGRWRAWVPGYNILIFVKLGDLNPWWPLVLIGAEIVLFWVPGLNGLVGLALFVYTLLAAWRVGLKLQKEAVWLILYFFLSIVWYGINAFDSSRWNLAIPAAPWATSFLADKTVWKGVPSQVPVGGYPPNPVAQPGYAAPGAYPPPAGYQQPPAGYQPPPAGYQQPPAGYQQPPAGFQQAPAGYQQPPGPPAGAPVPPPAAPPAASPSTPVPPSEPEPPAAPPAAPEPPAGPPTAPEPPAAPEPPSAEPPTVEPPAPEPPRP